MIAFLLARTLHALWPRRNNGEVADFVERMRVSRRYGLEQTRISQREMRRMTKRSVVERAIIGGHDREDTHGE
jgi:hypothetical protein